MSDTHLHDKTDASRDHGRFPTLSRSMQDLKRLDEQRPGVFGEHWATFGTGLTLLGWARRRRSPVLRTLVAAAAVLLLVRAATGRDGPLRGLLNRRVR